MSPYGTGFESGKVRISAVEEGSDNCLTGAGVVEVEGSSVSWVSGGGGLDGNGTICAATGLRVDLCV